MKKISNEELGRPTLEEYTSMQKKEIIVILDNIRSLNNIGSFFRTCDAFCVKSIALCGITATPPNKEIHKTALGAELSVEWEYFENSMDAVQKFKTEGYKIIAVEQVEGAVMLNDYQTTKTGRYALVFGNEVNGVGQEVVDMCDEAIEIPQSGTKHSLNVAVSGGIVIWEFYRNM